MKAAGIHAKNKTYSKKRIYIYIFSEKKYAVILEEITV